MNERVRKLAEQQGFTGPNFYISAQELEKFAESVIGKCIAVVEKRFMGDLNREDMEVRRCVEDIKQYWGKK